VIVCPIIIAPGGDATRSRTIATLEIENDTTGTEAIGHYKVRLRGSKHVDATVRNWPRYRGEIALVAEALRVLAKEEG
jgi:hypothetical protein